MAYKLTREMFIPKNSTEEKVEDANAVIYRYTATNGKPGAAMFGGRRTKPDNHYYYGTEEAREASIERYLDGQRANHEYKQAKRATKKNPNTLELDAILYTSWGYDQTNVDFYQVVDKPSAHFVVIRKIASETVPGDGNSVVARPNVFIDDEGRRVKANADNTVRISDGRGSAWEWDGQPKYETPAGFGH